MLKNKTQLKFVRKSFFAILYGLMSAIGINVFLSHAHSYSIGVPGIAQLLQAIFANFGISVSISFLMIIMNIPLFLFALKAFGFNYIVFSLMAVASNIFFLQIIPQVTVVTNDLTNTLVGAAIIGAGIGFCFNNGFSTGGTDVIVTYFQNKYKMKIGFINNLLNGIILILTAIFLQSARDARHQLDDGLHFQKAKRYEHHDLYQGFRQGRRCPALFRSWRNPFERYRNLHRRTDRHHHHRCSARPDSLLASNDQKSRSERIHQHPGCKCRIGQLYAGL